MNNADMIPNKVIRTDMMMAMMNRPLCAFIILTKVPNSVLFFSLVLMNSSFGIIIMRPPSKSSLNSSTVFFTTFPVSGSI